MPIQDITAIAIAIAAVLSAIAALIVAILTQTTLKETKKNSYAATLFRLDDAFLRYDDVRVKLTIGGDWHRKVGDPTFPKGPNYGLAEDFTAITSYMGLFERIQKLIDRELITIKEVDQWYSDRLLNIVLNDKIIKRLGDHKDGWSDFIKLWTALQEQRKQDSKRKWPKEALVPDNWKSN